MNYTRPPFDAADASWQGAAEYSRPPHDAADASWAAAVVLAQIAVPSPLGAPAVVANLPMALVEARIAVPGPLGAPAVVADVPVSARVAVPGPLGAPSVLLDVVQTALVAVPSPLGAPAVAATVLRFELRGVVRAQGVLVNRLVRAHRRDTGELVAEGDTVAGVFRLQVGFEPREHYVIPVHMDEAATDFAPPCANRVLSVLAMDEVAA